MERRGRNDRCGCGSGLKVKRCCGELRGPDGIHLVRAFLSCERRAAVRIVLRLTEEEIAELLGVLPTLPELDLSLHAPLPRLHAPEVAAVADAYEADDADRAGGALLRLMSRIDTPSLRARLVRAVLALRDQGDIDPDLAAVAVADLTTGSTRLLSASIVHAVAVTIGAERTPSGLLLASA